MALWHKANSPAAVKRQRFDRVCQSKGSRLVAGISSCIHCLFAQFLEFSGRIRIGLSGALPRVPTPPSAQPPKTLKTEEWRRLLSGFPRTTAVGKRDYAIALCLSKLALRSHEVTALTLEDINWQAGTLRLSRTKQRRQRLLPMPNQLVRALVVYLKKARPHTESRALFVHHQSYVGRPMSARSVRDVIRRGFERCGIAARGTHILRHTWATNAHRRGASLKLIADILGHSSARLGFAPGEHPPFCQTPPVERTQNPGAARPSVRPGVSPQSAAPLQFRGNPTTSTAGRATERPIAAAHLPNLAWLVGLHRTSHLGSIEFEDQRCGLGAVDGGGSAKQMGQEPAGATAPDGASAVTGLCAPPAETFSARRAVFRFQARHGLNLQDGDNTIPSIKSWHSLQSASAAGA